VTSRCAVGEVNPELFDDVGRFIARADVLFREWRVIVEYDGEQHRVDDRQYEIDQHRLERLRSAGWTVVQVRRRGLFVTQAGGEGISRERMAGLSRSAHRTVTDRPFPTEMRSICDNSRKGANRYDRMSFRANRA